MAFVERGIGTRKALSLIGLSPGSYYRKAVGLRRGRPADATTCKDDGSLHGNGEVVSDIRELLSMPYVDYGYRKVGVWLRDRRQWVINHKKVYRLMRGAGLLNPKRVWAALSRTRALGCSPQWAQTTIASGSRAAGAGGCPGGSERFLQAHQITATKAMSSRYFIPGNLELSEPECRSMLVGVE